MKSMRCRITKSNFPFSFQDLALFIGEVFPLARKSLRRTRKRFTCDDVVTSTHCSFELKVLPLCEVCRAGSLTFNLLLYPFFVLVDGSVMFSIKSYESQSNFGPKYSVIHSSCPTPLTSTKFSCSCTLHIELKPLGNYSIGSL